MIATRSALRDRTIVANIVQLAHFYDLASIQRVNKLCYSIVARHARFVVHAVLSRWFQNPSRVLAAMLRHRVSMPGTLSLVIARRLGFVDRRHRFRHARHQHGAIDRATFCLPDCSEDLQVSNTAPLARLVEI